MQLLYNNKMLQLQLMQYVAHSKKEKAHHYLRPERTLYFKTFPHATDRISLLKMNFFSSLLQFLQSF